MTKEMREKQAQIVAKQKEFDDHMAAGDLEKAGTAMDEVENLQKEFDLLERAEKAAKAGVPTAPENEQKETDAVKAFADAARAGFRGKDLNETTPADGGYTVPEDISTMVNTLREEHFSLASLISRETVSTKSGRRTYKKRAQHKGFTQVGEGGKIGKTDEPTFSIVDYAIKKFAGYMPVTNELLEDSDAAIANMMTEWLAQDSVATENAQILAKINEKAATPLTGLKDIKKAINVTLAAFAGSVRIVTNSDGLQYLDTLEDKNGRPLLSPDPVNPMELYLTVGTRRIPVTIVPNTVWPSAESGAIPFAIGDLPAYVKMFDRKQLTLMTTNVGAVEGFNAYEQDMTLVRAIMRADWVVLDEEAIVRGELTAS